MLAARVHGMDGTLLAQVLLEHGHERAGLQVPRHHEVEEPGDSHAQHGRVEQGGAMIRVERASWLEVHRRLRSSRLHLPGRQRSVAEEAQAVMPGQVLGRRGAAMAPQIRGGGTGHQPRDAQLPSHQPRVLHRAQAEQDVHTFGDGVHDIVSERQLDLQARVGRKEARQRGHEHELPEDLRRVDSEHAHGAVPGVGEGLLRVLQLSEDALAALMECAAVLGEAQRAGGPLEEHDAQLVLQPGDASAHGGGGDLELPGRAGEVTVFHGADEGFDVREGVH